MLWSDGTGGVPRSPARPPGHPGTAPRAAGRVQPPRDDPARLPGDPCRPAGAFVCRLGWTAPPGRRRSLRGDPEDHGSGRLAVRRAPERRGLQPRLYPPHDQRGRLVLPARGPRNHPGGRLPAAPGFFRFARSCSSNTNTTRRSSTLADANSFPWPASRRRASACMPMSGVGPPGGGLGNTTTPPCRGGPRAGSPVGSSAFIRGGTSGRFMQRGSIP